MSTPRQEWLGDWLYVSLDGEMSGVDLETGAGLISVGAATFNGDEVDTYYSVLNPGEMTWSLEAERVHGLSRHTVEAGPSRQVVDLELSSWLRELGGSEGQVVPVGVNFASFDAGFFKKYLPSTSSLLSHRTIDINSLCFTWAVSQGKEFSQVKAEAYDWANTTLESRGVPVVEHNAGYDAYQALLAWSYFLRKAA